MGPNKVFSSFMSSFGSKRDNKHPPSPESPTSPDLQAAKRPGTPQQNVPRQPSNIRVSPERGSDSNGMKNSSRPMSMVQTYQPPVVDLGGDIEPELQPIFGYLSSHQNKLYQEGYFLKLDDQGVDGRPKADRTWTECFAQLVGTILSLWDAAELDAAGADGEVLPTFINIADASIKMIEALPTRANDEQPLQNVLSISTAGKNRYLLHFNSHHSLVQWTAAIRLCLFEYTTLHESYTGALIAGKGKKLNNINQITSPNVEFKYQDWCRVRFGAGTPWRQCWCVISPPDKKELAELKKEMKKKKSVYDRSKPPVLKGNIKFYESMNVKKKSIPIASISDAYSAFAIFPQSNHLIEASTLLKLEGTITIHSDPPSTTEGFVYVLPDVHAAVSGFEILLRWLFPAFDAFHMYGRPTRLVADPLDPRCLMFAMPTERRYGYLDVIDVAGLISTEGSQLWSEKEWRKRLKDLTQRRMTAISAGGGSRRGSRRGHRDSITDRVSIRSTPAVSWGVPPTDVPHDDALPRTDSAPPRSQSGFQPPQVPAHKHHRSASDNFASSPRRQMDGSFDTPPAPPPHGSMRDEYSAQNEYGPDSDFTATPVDIRSTASPMNVQPVAKPPGFSHAPNSAPPANKMNNSPELRRAKSRMSTGTLHQIAGAGGIAAQQGVAKYKADVEEEDRRHQRGGPPQDRGVNTAAYAPPGTSYANQGPREGLLGPQRPSFDNSQPLRQPEESVTFQQTNIPSYYHNAPSQHYPNLGRPADLDGPKGPPLAALANPAVVAATGNYGANRTSYDSSRSSQDSNRRSLQRKPLPPNSPTRGMGPPGSPQRPGTAGSRSEQQRIDQFNQSSYAIRSGRPSVEIAGGSRPGTGYSGQSGDGYGRGMQRPSFEERQMQQRPSYEQQQPPRVPPHQYQQQQQYPPQQQYRGSFEERGRQQQQQGGSLSPARSNPDTSFAYRQPHHAQNQQQYDRQPRQQRSSPNVSQPPTGMTQEQMQYQQQMARQQQILFYQQQKAQREREHYRE